MSVLPIGGAYKFAKDNGLDEKAQEIRDSEFHGVSPKRANAIRKGRFIHIFEQNNLYKEFVEQYWPYGATPEGEVRRKNYLRLAQDFVDDQELGEVDDVGELETFKFTAEAHLRDFLTNNIEKIEPGLKIYEGKTGVEYRIDGGKGVIDILAVDIKGKFVVIELKNRKSRAVIGQLLYYMGWIDANVGIHTKPCRGIIIANELTEELKLAVSQVPQIKLARYKMSFSVENV